MSKDFYRGYKIIVVGDTCTGKSCLSYRYISGSFK